MREIALMLVGQNVQRIIHVRHVVCREEKNLELNGSDVDRARSSKKGSVDLLRVEDHIVSNL